MCVCICIYILYIYICTYTETYTNNHIVEVEKFNLSYSVRYTWVNKIFIFRPASFLYGLTSGICFPLVLRNG